MNSFQIIGLTGLAGAGKDTAGQALVDHLGFVRIAFADALRQEVCDAFSIPLELLTERGTKETPSDLLAFQRCTDIGFLGAMSLRLSTFDAVSLTAPRSPRQIMQWWGTEYRRTHSGPSYWTRKLKARVRLEQQAGQTRHVISDVRFDNEAAAVRELGGQIWQIVRPGLEHDASHTSETDGSRFHPDQIITNNATLEHLGMRVLTRWMRMETGRNDLLVGTARSQMTEQAGCDA